MFGFQEYVVPSVALLFSVMMIGACGRSDPVGQLRKSGELPLPDGVAGWQAAEAVQRWDPETIFSYIDGHAEVYLAYGMQSSRSRRYSGPEGEPDIVLDIFEMASAEDAYGVFTHDQDGDEVAVGQGGLYRFGWLSFWKGPYFVSISAEDDTDVARRAVLELGRAVDATIKGGTGPPRLVRDLPDEGLVPRSIRFLRSYQILNTHLYLGGDDPFGLGPDTSAVLASYAGAPGESRLLLVEHPDAARARSAAASIAARFLGGEVDGGPSQADDGRWYGLRVGGNSLAVVLAADDAETVKLMLERVKRGGS
jgi:hypothetical protein